ncbi:hypothetical protein C8J57DRAFT_1255091 [Mycena rebaudengoi]|nr:hypothetical protein C8J57DRAFT_1255091 [Mycena rebaudengoi]
MRTGSTPKGPFTRSTVYQSRRNAPREIINRWHIPAKPLPNIYSAHWDTWKDQYLLFHGMYDIPGEVEPLACHNGGLSGYFIFTAGGRYYEYSDGQVSEIEGEFTSKDDFLARGLANYGEMTLHKIAPQQSPENEMLMRWMPGF